ncbi:MAG: AbrB/MazE/SpoVT family DNA-binding domain-containing protein [Burkholderiales bacterium]|jgi:antitoxin MazE|nr:AbrB/MazE/SpoVT family DNA-binding domain-containing protein [Burkholderiales bacterium]
MKVQIAKWGNSAAVRLPKVVLDQLGLAPGAEVELVVKEGAIRMTAIAGNAPLTLAELVRSMDEAGPEGQSDTVDWGPDRGTEVIDDEYASPVHPAPVLRGKTRAS